MEQVEKDEQMVIDTVTKVQECINLLELMQQQGQEVPQNNECLRILNRCIEDLDRIFAS